MWPVMQTVILETGRNFVSHLLKPFHSERIKITSVSRNGLNQN